MFAVQGFAIKPWRARQLHYLQAVVTCLAWIAYRLSLITLVVGGWTGLRDFSALLAHVAFGADSILRGGRSRPSFTVEPLLAHASHLRGSFDCAVLAWVTENAVCFGGSPAVGHVRPKRTFQWFFSLLAIHS